MPFSTTIFIIVCSIRDCKKYFKNGDMVMAFNTENLRKNYDRLKMMAICGNKTVGICTVPVWKSNDNRNEECKLLVNSTSGHASVTVNNGMKYKSCIKILSEFHRSVHCGVPGGSGQKEMVEAVDGGWYELTRINLACKCVCRIHVYNMGYKCCKSFPLSAITQKNNIN
jgi:hypothetical protein